MQSSVKTIRISSGILTLLLLVFPILSCARSASTPPPYSPTSIGAFYRAEPTLRNLLSQKSFSLGDEIFIRIFKEENELEVWVKSRLQFELFKTYTICDYSGTLGPKLKEGDKQSPEGFYHVSPDAMHPWSKYHLAFNLGFPNHFDQVHNRTGSAIMIHGRCSSIGCFAMADFRMDEIYTLADAAIRNGQNGFDVHIFPFRLTRENLDNHRNNKWFSFWSNLKEGYDYFEKKGLPPQIGVSQRQYTFSNRVAHNPS